MNKNISKETQNRLYRQFGLQILEYEKNADTCASLLFYIENKPKTDSVIVLEGILRTQLMLCYINLDLYAAYRQYLSIDTSTNYEKRQAITKINVVMSEGYKKIYGFTEKEQNKSFWMVQVKLAVNFFKSYSVEYTQIGRLLHDIAKDNIINKDMRDLTIHYDNDPLKVYKMLSILSAEEVANRCNKFLGVLAELNKFVLILISEMTSKLTIDE
jgi:hypothetical protein